MELACPELVEEVEMGIPLIGAAGFFNSIYSLKDCFYPRKHCSKARKHLG